MVSEKRTTKFFFFKQKTAYEMRISDWSSDVCSSDFLEDEAPEPRQIEDVLDDDGAGEQEGELQAHDGDHGDERVAHRMAPERGAAREALGARRADVVLPQGLQNRGAGDAREDRRLRQGERDRRQQQGL